MFYRKNVRSGHRAAIYDLETGNDGFYSAAADGFLVHWHREDADFGQVVASVEMGKFLCLTAMPEGLVAGTLDGGVHWLYPEDKERNRHVAHHGRGTYSVIRVEDELFSGGGDGVLTRWSVTEARTLESLPLSANSLRRLAYDPVQDRLAIGASDGNIYLVNRSDLSLLDHAPAHPPSVFAVAFSSDGNSLFTGGRDAGLTRWNVSGQQLADPQSLTAHLATINALAVSPDGKLLATASRDKTVKIWNAEDLTLLKVLEVVRDKGHVNSVNTLAWLDDDTLITAGDDRRVLEWKKKGRSPL